MRVRPGWMVGAWVLATVTTAWAQGAVEVEQYIPEECRSSPPPTAADFAKAESRFLVMVIAYGIALFPLCGALAAMAGGMHAAARRWAGWAIALGCLQTALGLHRALSPDHFYTPTWFETLTGIPFDLADPGHRYALLGAGVIGAAAAWGVRRWAISREASPAPITAGERVRCTAGLPRGQRGDGAAPAAPPTASGAGPAPPG